MAEPTKVESDVEMTEGDVSMADAEEDQSADSDDDSPKDDDDSNDDASSKDASAKDPSAALVSALTHKESGNANFSSNNLIEASRSYRKGISLLKTFIVTSGDANSDAANSTTSEDDLSQILALAVTLHTNLSTVCYKQQKYTLSRDAATKALEIQPNLKSLYRRALAYKSLGETDLALADLKSACELDPSNTAVKKEMASIRKERQSAKENEKKRMMKAFSSSLLYGDKEEEERRKEMEKKEREEQERLKKEKRKAQWEEECVEKLKNGEEVPSFDDWEKERLQSEKKEKEEKERKEKERKEAERKKRQQQRRERSEKEESDNSEDELTERELAMLRGYKKTSDGRTTSYFTREQTEKEKELIGCIQPKRLESNGTSSSVSSSIVTEQPKVGSVWNRAGTTWEEKDTTEWCTSCLRECLSDSIAVHTSQDNENDVTYIAQVKGIDSLSGDASVALAGGKKRYIYDFHATISYKINKDTEVVASGSLKLPDINSAHTAEEELEVEIGKWKVEDGNEVVETCRDLLMGEVRKSVLKFVERFNANF